MNTITFTIPGAPVGKGRPRVGKIGNHARLFTPQKTVNYESLVAHSAMVAMGGRPMFEGAVSVDLFIGCQIPESWSQKKKRAALAGLVLPTTKPDKDNVIKAVYDGLNGVVWRDDVQVTDGTQRKRYTLTPGVRVEVSAVDLTPEEPQLELASA